MSATTTAPPATEEKPPSKFRRSWDKYSYFYAMAAPVLLLLGIFIAWPLVQGVYLSLTNATLATLGSKFLPPSYDFIGFDNYVAVLSGDSTGPDQGLFWTLFLRSVAWTILGVFFHYTIGLILAVVLNRQMRGRTFYRVMLVLPWAVPAFVSAFAWRYLFNETFGFFNLALAQLGVDPIPWLGSPGWAFFSVVLVNVWLGFPFMMVALLGGMQSISADLYEAAEIDGASAWQRFRNITMPGLKSVSMTVILLGTIWTFNQFAVIFLITNGQPGTSTEILVTYAYKLFRPLGFLAYSSTYGVIILAILLVFSTLYRRALKAQGEDI